MDEASQAVSACPGGCSIESMSGPTVRLSRAATRSTLALLMLAFATAAFAALGGNAASVQADSAHMRGALMIPVRAGSYTVHEIRMGTGTVVREYVSGVGSVFAVAWQGPVLPDLRQLLGPYFDQYAQAARAARAGRSGHGPLVIEERGLVVHLGGRPRAFAGKAFLPDLLPAGVQPETIR